MNIRCMWVLLLPFLLPARLLAADHPPVPIEKRSPAIPLAAYKAGIPLTATIRFLVEADGHVSRAKVIRASREDYGSSAADGVLEWKYQAAVKDGKPVKAWLEEEVRYDPPKMEAADDQKVTVTRTDEGMIMTLPDNLAVTNPPQEVAENAPTLKTFGKLLREFFECDGFAFDENGFDRLKAKIAGETSNGLFAKWKQRESGFRGAIAVEPMQANHEQVIIVRARILYLEKGTKTLRTETVMVHYSGKGVFKGIGTALGTKQAMLNPTAEPSQPGRAGSP